MSAGLAERFAAALQKMEQTKDVEPVAALFADDASLSSPERDVEERGQQAVRNFWKQYLNSFDQIRSEFHLIHESQDVCVLEWESEGSWKNGKKVNYRGVSLLEVDGDRVRRFATYYDTSALEHPASVGA